MLTSRGTLRQPKFSEWVEAISVQQPKTARIIEGAVWEIQRNPKACGVYIEEIGVWQARLAVPSSPDLLLFYSVAPRFVTMLTIVTADGSSLP
jgi:hypothetical protein